MTLAEIAPQPFGRACCNPVSVPLTFIKCGKYCCNKNKLFPNLPEPSGDALSNHFGSDSTRDS
jgi:hypothetical protein